MKLTEDIKPVTQLKTRAARVLEELRENQRPVVITQNGKASAVLLDVESYEKLKSTVLMMRLLSMSDADAAAGRVHSHAEVFSALRKKLSGKRR